MSDTSFDLPAWRAALDAAAPPAPGDQTRPLDAAERYLMRLAQAEAAELEPPQGAHYLLFTCMTLACAVTLETLREVLPTVPATIPLPHTPSWMFGLFALRAELLGLVDPAPLLLGASAPGSGDPPPTATILVGDGEHTLGWAVERVGAITLVRDDEILRDPPLTASIADRYYAGLYTPADGGQRHIILHARHLLDDLLLALEERDG